MNTQTDDVRIADIRPLISPDSLMQEVAPSAEDSAFVASSRKVAEDILAGKDDRLLVVVGPCSIHDSAQALEYADRLAGVVPGLSDDLLVMMRVYFEKPRTTVGWKGLINDPHLDDSYAINDGLRKARELLLTLTERRLAAGTEFLDTITPQYIADLVSWGAIGARTTESQVHRQLASGLSMPVGFKNGTDGNIKIAMDAIGAAKGQHHFLSVTKQGKSAIVKTTGNAHCHVILRGSTSGPNHQAEAVGKVLEQLDGAGLISSVMIDCSHGNSLKKHENQPGVCSEIAAQVAGGQRGITGVMIESHLVEGNQPVGRPEELVYGQSITDACVSWETTVPMLEELAAAVRKRREG